VGSDAATATRAMPPAARKACFCETRRIVNVAALV